MAKVTITGPSVRDSTTKKDNRPWYAWAAEYQDGLDGGVVTPRRSKPIYPSQGVLAIELESGIAAWIQNPDGNKYLVTVPDTNTNLWDLISDAVAYPPDTRSDVLSTAVGKYVMDNADALVGVDGVQPSTDGLEVEFLRGENVVGSVPIPGSTVDTLLGATAVGKAVAKAADQAAARSAIDAVTVISFNGTTWPARPADSGPVVFVGGIAPGNEPPGVAGDVWIPTVEDGTVAVAWDAITGKPDGLLSAATVAALTAKTGLAAADVLALFDSEASGAAKKVSLTSLLAWTRANEPDLLTAGEGSMPRGIAATTATLTTQNLRLRYFTAKKTETVTKARTYTGSTAAGATPSLCRVGIYSVDPTTGDLTLVASTPNDTTLWAATSTAYEKSLSASWSKVAGTRYATGVLCVTSAAAPTVVANSIGSSALAARAPRLTGIVTGLSDLPSTVSAGSVGASSAGIYVELVP